MGRIGNALRRLADEGRLHSAPVDTSRDISRELPPASQPAADAYAEPTPERFPEPIPEQEFVPEVGAAPDPPAPATPVDSHPASSIAAPILVESLENPGAAEEPPGELWPARLPPEIEIDWLADDYNGQADSDDDGYYSPAIRTLAELDADDSGAADQTAY